MKILRINNLEEFPIIIKNFDKEYSSLPPYPPPTPFQIRPTNPTAPNNIILNL